MRQLDWYTFLPHYLAQNESEDSHQWETRSDVSRRVPIAVLLTFSVNEPICSGETPSGKNQEKFHSDRTLRRQRSQRDVKTYGVVVTCAGLKVPVTR